MTNSLASNLLEVIDRAITGRPREFTLQDTAAAIAANAQTDLVSSGDLKTLRGFQKQHEAFGQMILDHTDTKARADWLKQNEAATAKMLAGTFDPERDLFTREDFEEDYRQRLDSAKHAQRQITQDCLPIAERAVNAFAKAAEKLAAQIEADDQAAYKKFAVRYEPSPLVNRIRECARWSTTAVAGCKGSLYASHSPRALCPFLGI